MAPKPKTTLPPIPPYLKAGSQVEISSDDEGFRGSWFSGTVIRRSSSKTPNKYVIQYETLFNDDKGKEPLKETLDLAQLRPVPPPEKTRVFKFGDEVDAYHNDGWWEGVITDELHNERFAVFFRTSREQMEFGKEEMRLHREWVNGKWEPPFAEEEVATEEKTKEVQVTTGAKCTGANKRKIGELQDIPNEVEVKHVEEDIGLGGNFPNGSLVEVSNYEEGFKGAWFAATIVEAVGEDKFLVEYETLRTDDDSGFLREEIISKNIRPRPPETVVIDRFKLLEEVDALYQDAWWVGVIAKILSYPNYRVFFKDSGEDLKFEHSQLRLHQDWIDGKWIKPSLGLKL